MGTADRLQLARNLVLAFEQGSEDEAADVLRSLHESGSRVLLRNVAELTRDLHHSLIGLSSDPQLAEMTRSDMPDARHRLSYVIEKTEASAHRVLAAIEDLTPIAERLVSGATAALAAGDMATLKAFIDEASLTGELMQGGLSEILMAQEYQDLTGQVIRRTIEIVAQVEGKLLTLLTAELPGGSRELRPARTGAQGPVIGPEANSFNRQDDVDTLLAELGL
ncbi:MAG: hypothetical protein EXR83_04045 [Gammaproteobacteria bacterium]|nr:hypothetical protein [Gammaproteobacteria bacterium]